MSLKEKIKGKANELGFLSCGVSNIQRLDSEAQKLSKWLEEGRHGSMKWMENHFDKRVDPSELVEGAKSVISFAYNYYPAEKQFDADAPKISKYAYGQDYHHVIKSRLREIVELIERETGGFNGRVFVDSAPVMEKAWAVKAGIGWQGKNTNIISRKHGSFFFLAEIICDLELEPDGPIEDYCGTCDKCIQACPTDALQAYVIDATRCISYLTIELRDEKLPSEFKGKMENWAFGCDICQDVCPFNKLSQAHSEPLFFPKQSFLDKLVEEWREINRDEFNEMFRKSAVKRTKFEGFRRNLEFLE